MALNKQIWINSIQENFFPDNSFMVKSVDDSAFVDNKTVHVPGAGAPSNVKKNRSEFPASVTTRTDTDLTYDINEFTSDPIRISEVEKVELSYDKRQSVIYNDREKLRKEVAQDLLYSWFKAGQVLETTGANRDAHTSSTATGNRKKITKKDVLNLQIKFNEKDVPATDRFLLLDSTMYADLLDDLTSTELSAFLASVDAQKGILGNLYGFDVMQRSKVLRLTSAKALLKWDEDGAATELAAGLAWQLSCVSRALGETKMFTSNDEPTYYSDILSFLLRAGGKYRRYDGAGVYAIAEATGATA